MRQLVAAAKQEKPDALVVIDYPDFNFRLLWRIKKLGIPVIYYVSPQLWAWRAGRIRIMRRAVDRVQIGRASCRERGERWVDDEARVTQAGIRTLVIRSRELLLW